MCVNCRLGKEGAGSWVVWMWKVRCIWKALASTTAWMASLEPDRCQRRLSGLGRENRKVRFALSLSLSSSSSLLVVGFVVVVVLVVVLVVDWWWTSGVVVIKSGPGRPVGAVDSANSSGIGAVTTVLGNSFLDETTAPVVYMCREIPGPLRDSVFRNVTLAWGGSLFRSICMKGTTEIHEY